MSFLYFTLNSFSNCSNLKTVFFFEEKTKRFLDWNKYKILYYGQISKIVRVIGAHVPAYLLCRDQRTLCTLYIDILKIFLDNHKKSYWICTFSVKGCWGQPMLLFWKPRMYIYQKSIISGFQKYFQTRLYFHISICQSQFIMSSLMWDTLYFMDKILKFRTLCVQ